MEWWQILLLVIVGEIGINFVVTIVWALESSCEIYDFADFFEATLLLPHELKYETNMNWFGCWVTFIVLFLLFPIAYIIKLIYWLFHI